MIMYDMYPADWTDASAARPQDPSPDRPRRRPRKAHSVVPAIIAQQLSTLRDAENRI
jgi:hypothetical protein